MLISLTGPSGIGKGFIKQQALIRFPELQEAIWLTTRQLREDETSKRSNRQQIGLASFQQLQAQGEIIFAQELFGNLYGISKSGPWFTGIDQWIIEFHIENLLLVKRSGIEVFSIGLIPETIDLLAAHLSGRSSEKPHEIDARLSAAQNEIGLIRLNYSAFDEIFVISEKNKSEIVATVLDRMNSFLAGE